ncbi:glycosyltransferase family 2 protein [Methylobacterium sp. P31]
MTTVSVVIPAFNAAPFIGRTIESVLSQTWRSLEIVVVDDGSSDDTVAIAQSCCRGDDRVRIVRQENQGVAAARNRGIQESSAHLIAFLDADDIWAPTKISEQLASLRTNEAAAVSYTGFVNINESDRLIGSPHLPSASGPVLKGLAQLNFVGNASSMLVRRSAIEEIGYFDTSLRHVNATGCEDYDFLLRLAEKFEFAVVPAPLVLYRITTASMSSNAGRMARSWSIVAERAASRSPHLRSAFARGWRLYCANLFFGALRRGRIRDCFAVLKAGHFWHSTLFIALFEVFLERAVKQLRKKLSGAASRASGLRKGDLR